MLYIVVEHFKNNDPVPVYQRFCDRGRLAPDGLIYVSSWVDDRMRRCFQLMDWIDFGDCPAKAIAIKPTSIQKDSYTIF
jgi:hypothetical protein